MTVGDVQRNAASAARAAAKAVATAEAEAASAVVVAARFEVQSDVPFLKPGAFDAQNLITIPTVKLIRRLGALTDDQMTQIEFVLKQWLGLQ